MIELTRESFNTALENNDKLIIYFYLPEHGASYVGFSLMEAVDQMIGKDFEIFTVQVDINPEICELFDIKDVPEYICVKNKKIHKRAIQLKYSNQVLDLLK